MEAVLVITPRRVNQWMNNYISPGPVAPVGDVLVNEKLKKSCPEADLRFTYKDKFLKRRGAGVQDGTWYNAHNHGLAAKCNRQSFYDQPLSVQQVGFISQELRLGDLKSDTRLLGAPQFGWKSQKATILNARVTGEQFLPAPQGYMPQGISRGPEPRVNTLVDNTTPIERIRPLEPEQPLVTNVPKMEDRNNFGPGIENINALSAQNFTFQNRTGFMSSRG